MQYRYTINDKPLERCPECEGNLRAEGGIHLCLAVAERVIDDIPTNLDENGYLEDTDDHAVKHGFHSATKCGYCDVLLINLEGVEEAEVWSV